MKGKQSKDSHYANTLALLKKQSQLKIHNQLDREREASPQIINKQSKNSYSYQNLLQKISTSTSKTRLSDMNFRDSTDKSKIFTHLKHAQTNSPLPKSYKPRSDAKSPAASAEKSKKSKANNYHRQNEKRIDPPPYLQMQRPQSTSRVAQKGEEIMTLKTLTNLVRLSDSKTPVKLGYAESHRTKRRSPSPSQMGNHKGVSSDGYRQEGNQNTQKTIIIDMEKELHSKMIEDLMLPLPADMNPKLQSSASFQSNSSKPLRHAHNLLQSKEAYGIGERNFKKRQNIEEVYKSATFTNRDFFGKLSTASNSRTAGLPDASNFSSAITGLPYHKQNKSREMASTGNLKLLLYPQTSQNKSSSNLAKSQNLFHADLPKRSRLEDTSLDSSSQISKSSHYLPGTRREIQGRPSINHHNTSTNSEEISWPKIQQYFLGNSSEKSKLQQAKMLIMKNDSELEKSTQRLTDHSGFKSHRGWQETMKEKYGNNDYLGIPKKIPETTDDERFSTEYKIKEKSLTSRGEMQAKSHLTQLLQTERRLRNEKQKQKQQVLETLDMISSVEELEEKKLFFKRDYRIGKEIGRGAYASVRMGLHKPSNIKVAIKIYQKEKIMDPVRQKSVKREIKIMERMNHPNIIQIFDTVETRNSLNIIMEYVEGESLYHFLKAQPNRRVSENHAFKIFQQLVSALDYCHSRCITHRDIKLENVLISNDGRVKLIDFGFSTCFQNSKKVKLFCGTPSYMAPEIVQREECYGPPVDVWAVGVLLYALLCGELPFYAKGEDKEKKVYQEISKGVFNIPNHLSKEVVSFLKKILHLNPELRLTTRQILSDPWFTHHAAIVKEETMKHRRVLSADKVPQVTQSSSQEDSSSSLLNPETSSRRAVNPIQIPKHENASPFQQDPIPKKRSHTPNNTWQKNKPHTYRERPIERNSFENLRRQNNGTSKDRMSNYMGNPLDDETYHEKAMVGKVGSEIEVWNSGLRNSGLSEKKDWKNSILNKTIGLPNKCEKKENNLFPLDPDAVTTILKMGYTEEEIVSGIAERSGIIFAMYKWLTKDLESSQNLSSYGSQELNSHRSRKRGVQNVQEENKKRDCKSSDHGNFQSNGGSNFYLKNMLKRQPANHIQVSELLTEDNETSEVTREY